MHALLWPQVGPHKPALALPEMRHDDPFARLYQLLAGKAGGRSPAASPGHAWQANWGAHRPRL